MSKILLLNHQIELPHQFERFTGVLTYKQVILHHSLKK